jgi:hypothetical protein
VEGGGVGILAKFKNTGNPNSKFRSSVEIEIFLLSLLLLFL